MFGYVRPPSALPETEWTRFQQAYCGLCHTLGQRYGVAARFILNYDFTFLAILLAEPAEPEIRCARCLASPVRKKCFDRTNAAMELAADESVILAYWQLRDGVDDHGFWDGLQYRFLSMLLRPAYRKAAALRPSFDGETRRQLRKLAELSAQRVPQLDPAADAFAALLGAAAEEVDDPVRRRVLHQLLYHLGRWVYLMDAADDLHQDAASGNYNPVALRYGLTDGAWTAESRKRFVQTVDHSVHMMTTAFELAEFGVWTPLLEATLYTGLFQVGRAVLDGTFHDRPSRRKKKCKDLRKRHE